MNAQCQKFLDAYLNTLSAESRANYLSFSADYFCADEVNANLCAELIRTGQKTATCSMQYWYDHKLDPMPTVGHLHVVTDWQQNPVCIIEIDKLENCRFNQVSAAFAHAEGEGDRSLAGWRKTHWEFFSAECKSLDIEPQKDMMLLLEYFHVVYPKFGEIE